MRETSRQWLQRHYPQSRLRYDVRLAGPDAYYIIAKLVTPNGFVIASITHYGTGYRNCLDDLKAEAREQLIATLDDDDATDTTD